MSGYERLKRHAVSRLCHFTKLQSLTHILATADGIIASGSIRQDTKNVNDTARYDGELNHVCCTIEYPNSWFLNSAIKNNADEIFRDWVVLCIDLEVLLVRSAKFCECNASKAYGQFIQNDLENIDQIFLTEFLLFHISEPPKCSRAVRQMVRQKYLLRIISLDDIFQR